MLFGIPLLYLQVYGGVVLFLLLVFQTVVGLRWIKLGRKHFIWHRWIGYGILVYSVGHLLFGINAVFGLVRLG